MGPEQSGPFELLSSFHTGLITAARTVRWTRTART
jgi:hypothetical protein